MDQKHDFDLQLFLPYLLNQAAEGSSLEFQRIYKNRYGMLRTEWRVLFHLGIYGAMTAKDIGDRAKTHKTKISRAVAALEKRRFLKRTKSEVDRRLEMLELTPAGTAAYVDLHEEAAQYNAKLTSRLTKSEHSALLSALQKLSD